MVRIERESNRRRREEKWQTFCCCRDQQTACRMAQASAEKLEHTGPAEGKSVTSERAVGKNAGAALAKRKRNRVVCSKHQIVRGERVKVARERGGGSVREHGVGRMDSTVKKGRFQGEVGGTQEKPL